MADTRCTHSTPERTQVNSNDLLPLAKQIVAEANRMRNKHSQHFTGHVGYCAIFAQSHEEYIALDSAAKSLGKIAQDTPTGFTYLVPGIETDAGLLRILKIRKPDVTRKERGDADFSLLDYQAFKDDVIGKQGFSLIVRPKTEMIELIDSDFNVRAYFSNPPVETHDGIREALATSI